MYQNSLTGPLPSELGLLDGLVYLYLGTLRLCITISTTTTTLLDLVS